MAMDEEDDWILDSLQKYESLYMYELQHPTKCLDWTKGGSAVCVAGFSLEHNNEILQLAIPEKLLPSDKQSLCAQRDFKMINGALTKSPMSAIKSLEPSNFLLASCGQGCVIDLWTEDPLKSDMLKKAGEISLSLPESKGQSAPKEKSQQQSPNHAMILDHTHHNPTSLLLGSSLSLRTTQLVDVNTKERLFEFGSHTPNDSSHGNSTNDIDIHASPLHALAFVAGSEGRVFITCSGEAGDIKLWDIREKAKTTASSTIKHHSSTSQKAAASPSPLQQTYAMAVSRSSSLIDTKVAILERSGRLLVHDSRSNAETPLVECCVRREDSTAGVFRSRFALGRSSNLCLQFSPSRESLLSVSGINGGVQVYDTSSWSGHMTQVPTPIFSHDGHEKESPSAHVLVHSWQEGVNKTTTIFSADSEGSLHAWEWHSQ